MRIIIKIKDFEKGRKYERKVNEIRNRLFVGWGAVIFSFISLIGIFLTKTLPFWIFPGLFLIGIGNLWVGYKDKKGLNMKGTIRDVIFLVIILILVVLGIYILLR